MHSDPTSLGVSSFLILAFLGLLMLGGLALFIYSIVAKKYWLTILMVLLPVGFVLVVSFLFVGFNAITRSTEVVAATAMPAEVRVSPLPDEPWSETLPPTADIYPSIALCGRPLAYKIRQQRHLTQKMGRAVTFVKEERPGDHNQWKPPADFVVNFRDEFVKQFPGSTVGEPRATVIDNGHGDPPVEKAKAESISAGLRPLEIKLSFQPPENKSTAHETAGAISARWTNDYNIRTIATVHFVDKPWVADPKAFASTNSKGNLIVGYSQRLAISPEDATNKALENAGRNGPATRGQIVDRFTQKLTLPYGELWQGSVLIDKNIQPSHTESGSLKASATSVDSSSRSHLKVNGLILVATGLIAIGLISNLLTQGYYRQNIKHTVITGVAAVFGLLLLVLLVA